VIFVVWVDVYFELNYKLLDLEKTLFRLEHKDPTLRCLILSDQFHSLYPEEEGDVPNCNHSKHKEAVMDSRCWVVTMWERDSRADEVFE
jgi:hypothetical protein